MKRRLLWLPAVALSLSLIAGCARRSTPPLTGGRVVPYAQPAVVMISAFGDIEITGPTSATTKKQYEPSPYASLSDRPRGLSDLLSGNSAPPAGVEIVRVGTTEEMLAAAQAHFGDCDLFFAAAAPADYAPETVAAQKIKKGTTDRGLTIHLRETPDIVGTLAAGKTRQIVVGFAAETEGLLAQAAEKLSRKHLDLIVANDVTAEGAGFEVDTNVVTLLWQDGRTESLPKLPKRALADRLLDAVLALLTRKAVRGEADARKTREG